MFYLLLLFLLDCIKYPWHSGYGRGLTCRRLWVLVWVKIIMFHWSLTSQAAFLFHFQAVLKNSCFAPRQLGHCVKGKVSNSFQVKIRNFLQGITPFYLQEISHFYLQGITHSYLQENYHFYLQGITHSYLQEISHFYLKGITHFSFNTMPKWVIPCK